MNIQSIWKIDEITPIGMSKISQQEKSDAFMNFTFIGSNSCFVD